MDRIVSIYSLSTVSNLSVLVVAEPDFQWNSNFNGIQYWRHQRFCRIIFNVDFFLLSLLHYLLQDLIFIANPNRVCTSATFLETAYFDLLNLCGTRGSGEC